MRESIRIRALVTVTQNHISKKILTAQDPAAVRALPYSDSVGIGQYAMDVHMCAEGDDWSRNQMTEHHSLPPELWTDRTLPYQIPMGALIPEKYDGFIASGKNIGTTHITNGAYRLHPIEWHIGLASGVMAAYSAQNSMQPRELRSNLAKQRQIQDYVVRVLGSPIYWFSDVWHEAGAAFRATQMVAVEGIITGIPGTLEFRRGDTVKRCVGAGIIQRNLRLPVSARCERDSRFSDVPASSPYCPSIQALDKAGLLASIPLGADYNPDADMTLGDFREYLEMGLSDGERVRLMDNVQDTQKLSRPVSREDSALMSFNIMRRRYSLP